ncbi:MAG: preprotein translocase subunit SecG [Pseudomonadota bacterium]
MQNVLLLILILTSIALTVVVLLQRSEGGALGMGGGGGGGMMSGRGAAGALVRMTMLLGAVFMAVSLALTTIASRGSDTRTDIERSLEEDAAGVAGDARDTETPLFTDPLDEPLLDDVAPAPATDPLADPVPTAEPADPLEDPAE